MPVPSPIRRAVAAEDGSSASIRPRADGWDESALIEAARAGDRGAFERLATASFPALLGTASRMLRDRLAAEEVVAEGLFRAWRSVGRFRGDSAFGTWLHRIVCRVAVDRFRQQARDRRHQDALVERARGGSEAGRDPSELLADAEAGAWLRGAVERLPSRQRLVLVLHVWEGLSLAETAEVLDVRYATAKSNLCHARRTLREAWVEASQ